MLVSIPITTPCSRCSVIGVSVTTLKRMRLPGHGSYSLKSTNFQKIDYTLLFLVAIKKITSLLIQTQKIYGRDTPVLTESFTETRKITFGKWANKVPADRALKFTLIYEAQTK